MSPRRSPSTSRACRSTGGRRRRGLPSAAGRVAAAAVAGVLLLSGCELRLETPEPTAPAADEVETVRQRTTADAISLHVLADRVAGSTPDPTLAAAVAEVAARSVAHTEALGGVYVPFPDRTPQPTDSPAGTPAGAPSATPASTGSAAPGDPTTSTVVDVVALLDETAASARADAAAVTDGPLARLVASISVARATSAQVLADLAAVPAESRTAPEPLPAPESVPAGVPGSAVTEVVRSQDAVGFAYEVVAARSEGDARASTAARAVEHRDSAELWAAAAGILGTDADPRRASYALPDVIVAPDADPAAVAAELAALEGSLVAAYASMVAQADPGARSPLIDAMLEGYSAQRALAGTQVAFPGMPEQVAAG